MKTIKNKAKGFTLLELLIVIAILAVLSVTLVLVLNPAESLRKSRDTQRMSDLATIKTAIGLYLTTVSSPDLSTDVTDNARCTGGATPKVFYSTAITDADVAGSTANVVSGSGTTTDGLGWLPVKLDDIAGGSPISNMPLDPSNNPANTPASGHGTVSTSAAVTNGALVYRYACDKTNLTFEIDAKLESTEFDVTADKAAKDGGNNPFLYEVGTKMDILPATDTF